MARECLAGPVRVDPGQQYDQSWFELTRGKIQGMANSGLICSAGLSKNPDHPAAQLGVGGHHVDHEVGPGVSEPDHDRGGEAVEHQLLCGAGLEPGGAHDDLGTGVDGQEVHARTRKLGVRVRGDEHGQRSDCASHGQRARDVRRAA